MFVPCFIKIKDMLKAYQSSDKFISNNFSENFHKLQSEIEFSTTCAKLYIYYNYEKVKEWSNLRVNLISYNPNLSVDKNPSIRFRPKFNNNNNNNMFNKLMKDYPVVETLTKVILDPSDGDLSLTVNDIDFWWIDNDAVNTIADYIYKQINN